MQTVIARSFKTLKDNLKKSHLKGKKIGIVPTMGCLHNGHLALIKKCLKLNYFTVVTIFLNPIQFNNKNDLKKYPAQEKIDIRLLKKNLVDLIFIPKLSDIYPEGYSTYLYENIYSKVLCGKHRNNHFLGVTTVVLKLFLLIKPNAAFFGEKDLQQLLIIRKIIKDLNLDIKLEKVSTIRDSCGLALSSRNKQLSKKNLYIARNIYKNIKKVECYKHEKVKQIKSKIKKFLNLYGIKNIEYLEILETKTFKTPQYIDSSKETRIFIAVKLGSVRLIDNYKIKKS